jgi:hypothetical protein
MDARHMTARVLLIEDVVAFVADPSAVGASSLATLDGPLDEWLRDTLAAPGRLGVHRRGGAERVPAADWGFTPDPDELVIVLVAPGVVEATVGTILLNIALSLAVSAALTVLSTVLFPTASRPRFSEAPQPSPVYSLGPPANEARLGLPLPVVYGEVVTVPDLASTPYSRFVGNEEIVSVLLTVTVGDASVLEVLAGEASLDDLPAGVARWRAFRPDVHRQRHGFIGGEFGMDEDVVTSIDVQGAEIVGRRTDEGRRYATEFIAPRTIRLSASADVAALFEAGDTISVDGSALNDGAYVIASTTAGGGFVTVLVEDEDPDPITDEVGSAAGLGTHPVIEGRRAGARQSWIFSGPDEPLALAPGDLVVVDLSGGAQQIGTVQSYSVDVEPVGETNATINRHSLQLTSVSPRFWNITTGTITLTRASAAPLITPGAGAVWVGWFNASARGQMVDRIDLDIAFPAGLFKSGAGGALEAESVTFRLEWRRVDGDEPGEIDGADLVIVTTDYLPTGDPLNTPLRLTHSVAVDPGRWQVRIRRVSPVSAAASDQSRGIWTALKGRRVLQSGPVYGPCTMLAVELVASKALSEQAIRRIRARVRRLTPALNDDLGTGRNFSRSPARAAYDLLCSPSTGLGVRPADLFDMTELRAAATRWEAAGLTFDFVVTETSSAWAALELIFAAAGAEPLAINGRIGVLQRGPRAASLLFSPANILGGPSIDFRFQLSGDADGVRTLWRSAESGLEQTATWPPSAIRPSEVQVWGVTSPDVALAHARVRWERLRRAAMVATFETGPEGRIARRGERIGLAWPTFGWGEAALLTAQDGLVLTLDRAPPPLAKWAALRAAGGAPSEALAVTVTGEREITLAAAAPFALTPLGGGREPTHVCLAIKSEDLMLDLVVEEIAWPAPGRARIVAAAYDAEVFAGTPWAGMSL